MYKQKMNNIISDASFLSDFTLLRAREKSLYLVQNRDFFPSRKYIFET
jgi:hypothetical protein